ncbi:MAG: N-acetyltransferase [Proteobacteria bacterium]|nr:N-acetyltransferase [Pseudomonadota bacterium]
MIRIETEKLFDVAEREALLDRAFGPTRHQKTCERLREGRLPAQELAFVLRGGDRVLGTLRFWHVDAGGVPALMLGPLAVEPMLKGQGFGSMLMEHGLLVAQALGHKAVILVGDAPYYARWGFSQRHTRRLVMPGPVENERFLGLELEQGALASASGRVRATGAVPLRAAVNRKLRKAA